MGLYSREQSKKEKIKDKTLSDPGKHQLAEDKALEILTMQQKMGNNLTARLLECQEDDELSTNLSLPIKEKKEDGSRPLTQLRPRHGAPEKEEYPQKIGELATKTGIAHVGILKKEKQVVLVTEEKRDDQKKEPLHNQQKGVYRDSARKKSEGSQLQLSQDWEKGAVAIIDNADKKAGKILGATRKSMEKAADSGNLKNVFPCLDQKKEEREKDLLQQQCGGLNRVGSTGDDKGRDGDKKKFNQKISKKNTISTQKKTQERELGRKLGETLQMVKELPQQLRNEDFYDLIWQKRRKRRGDEISTEAGGQVNEQEEEEDQNEEE